MYNCKLYPLTLDWLGFYRYNRTNQPQEPFARIIVQASVLVSYVNSVLIQPIASLVPSGIFFLLFIFSGRMNWTTLIITLMSTNLSHNIKQNMVSSAKENSIFLNQGLVSTSKVSGKNALGEKKTVHSNTKRHTTHKRS